MDMNPSFWLRKKVFITGHTGFKGSWLTLWLLNLGAEICGYSLEPDDDQILFKQLNFNENNTSENNGVIYNNFQDIRDFKKLQNCILKFKPDVVFHLAAQPLVKKSYQDPLLSD